MSSVPERPSIDERFKWDLESIYSSDEAWEEALVETRASLDDLRAYEGRTTDDAQTLYSLLELRDEVMREVSKIVAYARMRSDEDTRDATYQAMSTRARSFSADAGSAASFIQPELQSLDTDRIESMVEDEPALERYDHYLDDVLRMRPHVRSSEVEALLADLGEVLSAPSDVYNVLTNADMTYPTVEDPDGDAVEITQSNFTRLLKHSDRAFRRQVYEAFYGELAAVRHTIGSTLSNSVIADVKLAEARDYESARAAAMFGPNIPTEVYDTLVETVREHLDVLHRHLELKRTHLGVDELEMWDLYVPMTDSESPTVTYEEATEYVVDAVAPLGEDYRDRVAEGLRSRWVDVYENRGKQSGAYSGGTYDTHPFILMNYQDDMASMYTLAHELGHSLHSQLTSESQPYVYSGYEIFVAEVASTVNEMLLTHHLLDTEASSQFRRHVLSEYAERFRATLFRQTKFADFEHQIHRIVEEDDALTPDRLDEIYGDLKAEFYAPARLDEHIRREWMRIPHFYYNYYVYQYATGISAAGALTQDILEEGEPAADRYLDFLRSGSREYPLDLLRTAGVDMTSPEPIVRAIDGYGDYLDELTPLIG